jgi:hypothetical protein
VPVDDDVVVAVEVNGPVLPAGRDCNCTTRLGSAASVSERIRAPAKAIGDPARAVDGAVSSASEVGITVRTALDGADADPVPAAL